MHCITNTNLCKSVDKVGPIATNLQATVNIVASCYWAPFIVIGASRPALTIPLHPKVIVLLSLGHIGTTIHSVVHTLACIEKLVAKGGYKIGHCTPRRHVVVIATKQFYAGLWNYRINYNLVIINRLVNW